MHATSAYAGRVSGDSVVFLWQSPSKQLFFFSSPTTRFLIFLVPIDFPISFPPLYRHYYFDTDRFSRYQSISIRLRATLRTVTASSKPFAQNWERQSLRIMLFVRRFSRSRRQSSRDVRVPCFRLPLHSAPSPLCRISLKPQVLWLPRHQLPPRTISSGQTLRKIYLQVLVSLLHKEASGEARQVAWEVWVADLLLCTRRSFQKLRPSTEPTKTSTHL